MEVIFKIWRQKTKLKLKLKLLKQQFKENLEEETSEINFARENGMESIYWCWNCKYGECEIH